MKKVKLLPLMALAMPLAFMSCKKDKEAPAPTKTQLLTAKPWKLTAMTITPAVDFDGDGDTETDYYAEMESCQKDDFTKYSAANNTSLNGTVTYDEGLTKCNTNDPQTTTSTWVLNTEQTTITETDASGESYSSDLLTLTGTSMVQRTQVEVGGTTYTLTGTFTAQ